MPYFIAFIDSPASLLSPGKPLGSARAVFRLAQGPKAVDERSTGFCPGAGHPIGGAGLGRYASTTSPSCKLTLPPMACRPRTFRTSSPPRAPSTRRSKRAGEMLARHVEGHAQRWRAHPTALQLRRREEARPELSGRHASACPTVATLSVSKPTRLDHLPTKHLLDCSRSVRLSPASEVALCGECLGYLPQRLALAVELRTSKCCSLYPRKMG